ncbi:CPBP family intramembrane glutamic endopeptidase [Leucobacter chromiiresistens]|uniref:CPBP family intramembrane glutamic endopeptidase n=1 Tax=Leucobacter chromiiresistens TaxID=1079994 RepID=UPI000A8AC5EE|nr:CPBP family intramembrane glutamic endopeptidase [Leucobacter chromiiresistens]
MSPESAQSIEMVGAEGVSDGARAPRPDRVARVPWGAVALFTVVACGLAWLVALPLWRMDPDAPDYGLWFGLLAAAMMFTPAIATVVMLFAARAPRRERLRFLGMWPLRPARRVVWFTVAALFAPLLVVLAAVGVSALFGWVRLDLAHFSGFQATLDAQLATLDDDTADLARATMPPVGLLVALQLVMVPFGALVNSVLAFGEEIGWRGWLLPALLPLGTWPAILVSGAVWGLWHSPLILLGYNFGLTDWRGVALMTAGCIAWGALLGWSRLRSGSVWPAVVGHGALNASAGVIVVLAAADSPLDPALAMPLGVSGWIVIAIAVAVLAVCGQFRADRQPQLAPRRMRSAGDAPSPAPASELHAATPRQPGV